MSAQSSSSLHAGRTSSGGLSELLNSLSSLEEFLHEEPLSVQGTPSLFEYQISRLGSDVNMALTQEGHEAQCHYAGWHAEKIAFENEIRKLRVDLSSARTQLAMTQAELVRVRATSAEMEAKYTSFLTNDSAITAIPAQQAELAARQDAMTGPEVTETNANSSLAQDDMMGTSSPVLSDDPDAGESGGSVPHSLFKAIMSVYEQVALHTVIRPHRLMMPDVTEKFALLPSGQRRWRSKLHPFFIVQEEGCANAMAACFLPDDDSDRNTHLAVLPLCPGPSSRNAIIVDRDLHSIRKVAIDLINLLPVQGVPGEHGILIGSECHSKCGNIVVVASREGESILVKVKGGGGGQSKLQGPFSTHSVALCIMDKPLYE